MSVDPHGEKQLTTADSTTDETRERPGLVLAGKYKLIDRIGEGGMGSVWVAQQTEPVRRTVAVKLIKGGADSRTILARFEAERQALALMDHPNIARVLDAGATDSGRPYFVMELVKGVPITQFCDQRKLTPRQRLELFVPVCQAVQHAHQKGIIHRDLKPSNVLVAIYDDRPVPKVIDFGVAKATGPQLTEQTLHTGFGALVGTPQYMSPEQATLNNLDIDTRSDIYSLGVLLYELLAGSPPFRRKDIEKAGVLEMLRVIREEEPPKPSTKLSNAEALPSLAASRRMEPAKLTRLLRGEIDWIVMKALEKERSRRYETANGLALDIQRYLADEPVLAGPPSAAYRLRKFTKRHKGWVVAAALVLLTLLAGMAGTVVGLMRAERARQAEADRAESERLAKLKAEESAEAEKRAKVEAQSAAESAAEAEKKAKRDAESAAATAKEAKQQAEKRLKQVEKGAEILASVFRDIGPKSEKKDDASLRVLLGQRLEEAIKQLGDEGAGDPVAVTRLQSQLGRSLVELGLYDQAEGVLTKARQTLEASLGADHPDTLAAKNSLALLCQSQAKYPQAEALYKEVLEGQTAKLGADHPDTLSTKSSLALLYQSQGKHALAEPLFKEALEGRTAKLGADHLDTLATMSNLATGYMVQRKHALAEPLFKEVLEGQIVKLGADHLTTLATKSNLAAAYQGQGKLAPAEALLKEVLEGRTAKLGADHPSTLASKNNLGAVYFYQRKYAATEALLKELLEAQTAKLGADHPDTVTSKDNLAAVYTLQGKYPQAEPLLKDVLAVQVAKLGADHPQTLATKNSLAGAYQNQGKHALAEPLYKDVLETLATKQGADHPQTLAAKNTLAVLYWQMKKLDRSVPLFKELVEQCKKKLGADHPDTVRALANLGVNYRDAGRMDDGIRCLEQAVAVIRKFPGPVPGPLAWIPGELAQTYDQAKQYAKSEPLYRDFLDKGRQQFGDDDPRSAGLMAQLALNLLAQKKHADAEKVLRDCLAIRDKKQPTEWSTFYARSMLGEALVGQQKYTDAEPLLKDGYEGIKQRREKIPEPYRQIRLTEALQRLVQLYEATDKKDEAAKWRKELAAQQEPEKKPKP